MSSKVKNIVAIILGVLSFVSLIYGYFFAKDGNREKPYRKYLLIIGVVSAVAVPAVLFWDWVKAKVFSWFPKK